MMQSEIRNDKSQKPEVSMRNRVRLMQQNKRIVIEVYKLEQIISNLIEKDVTNDCELIQETELVNNKFKNQLSQQLKLISKLKKQIKKIKSTFAQHKYEQIKKQENQITFYKRQLQKLISERDILFKRKNEKQEALVFHKPINNQTTETYQKYKKIKAENGQIKLKIHEIEREVAKFHKYKELSKTSVPKQYDNPDYQFMRIDNQIKNMKKEMKRFEQKWKTKIQSLDKQYFTLRNIFDNKESEILLLEKQAKNMENRMTSHRDEIMVSNDRQRVNSVVISPQKRKEIRDLLQQQKKKLKRLEPKSVDFKSKFQKVTKQNSKQVSSKVPEKQVVIDKAVQQTLTEQKEVIKPLKITQIVKGEEVQQKGKKMVESVGVGTSFYYSDD